jgi:nucleotide-binding universal stress UspA family protein
MSIFPSRILLATDGSEQAELAVLRAVELADATHSELHVVHVGVVPISCRAILGLSATMASSTSRSKRSPRSGSGNSRCG